MKSSFADLAVIVLCCAAAPSSAEVSGEVVEMALDWAPLVWIHSEEAFYPSTVDFFMENTEVPVAFQFLAEDH